MRTATPNSRAALRALSSALTVGIALVSLLAAHADAAPRKSAKSKSKTGKIPAPEMHRDSMRFLSTEEQVQFIQKMMATVSISNRTLDPFCRPQDPDAATLLVTSTDGGTKPVAVLAQGVPFADIVNRIKINTINPKDRIFLIGEREYKQGGQITLNYRMRPIKAEIVSISSSAIVFRNMETKETATLAMNALPPGMKAGDDGFQAQGLHRNDESLPINLDD